MKGTVEGLASPRGRLFGVIQEIERRFDGESIRKKYSFADIAFEACYLDPISFELCHLSMVHLLNSNNTPTDWTFYVLDAKSSNEPIPNWIPKTISGTAVVDGSTQAIYFEEIKVLVIIDFLDKKAIYWAEDTRALLGSEKIFPFRHIVNMIFRLRGGLILHCAAIGRDGAGVLIVGKGGVGKSTLSLAGLCAGMQFVSDDSCLYYGGSVFNVTQFAKLNEDSLSLLTKIKSDEFKERNPKGKTILPLYDQFKSELVNSLKVKALIVPTFSKEDSSSFSSCSLGSALLAMAPTTISQIYGGHAIEMKTMAQLVREVHAYKMGVGSDLAHAIKLVDEIIALSF